MRSMSVGTSWERSNSELADAGSFTRMPSMRTSVCFATADEGSSFSHSSHTWIARSRCPMTQYASASARLASG